VKLYREKYKPHQGGVIGITLNGDMSMPYDNTPASKFGSTSAAAARVDAACAVCDVLARIVS
jgi:hypothetical protein